MSVLLTISLLIRNMLETDFKQLQNLLRDRTHGVPLVPGWKISHIFTSIKKHPIMPLGQ